MAQDLYAAVLASLGATSPSVAPTGTRTAVDADTINDPTNDRNIRLAGANAPETPKVRNGQLSIGEPGGDLATAVTQRLLNENPNAELTLTGEKTYNRDVGRYTLENGNDLGRELISRGAAKPTTFSDNADFDAERVFNMRSLGIGEFIDNPEARSDAVAMLENVAQSLDSGNAQFNPFAGRPGHDNGESTFTGSVERGTDNMQASLYGFANAFGEYFGIDPVAEWGEEGVQRNLLEAATNPAEIGTTDNIHSLADFGTYVVEAVGEQVPNLALMATGGGAGALAARAAIGKAAIQRMGAGAVAKRGAAAGAFGTSYPLGVGEIQNELKEAGIDEPGSALLAGIPFAGLDVLSAGTILTKAFKDVGVKSGVDLLKQVAKGFGLSAATEGTTESLQELINITTRAIHDPEFEVFSDENLARMREAGIKGGLVGGLVGGAGRAAKGAGEWLQEYSRSGINPENTQEGGGDLTVRENLPGGTPPGGSGGAQAPQTMPESPADVQAAVDAVGRGGRIAAFSETGFDGVKLPDDFVVIDAKGGGYYAVPAIDTNKVQRLDAQDKRHEVLGYPAPKPENPDGTVVQARDADGRVVQDVVANARTPEFDAALAQAREAAGQGGSVNVTTAEQALGDRAERLSLSQKTPEQLQVEEDAKAFSTPDYKPTRAERTLSDMDREAAIAVAPREPGFHYRDADTPSSRLAKETGKPVVLAPDKSTDAKKYALSLAQREQGYRPEADTTDTTAAYRNGPVSVTVGELITYINQTVRSAYPDLADPNSEVMRGFRIAATMLDELAKRFGVSRPELMIFPDTAFFNGIASARTGSYMGMNRNLYISLSRIGKKDKTAKDRLAIATAMETLYHEFGHTLQFMLLQTASRKDMDALLAEYRKWVRAGNNRSATTAYVGKAALAHKAETFHGNRGPEDHEGLDIFASNNVAYLLSVQEWWADQVAKYIANKEPPADAPKLIKQFATWLRRLYAALAHVLRVKGLPAPTVKEFLDRHIEAVRKAGTQDASALYKVEEVAQADRESRTPPRNSAMEDAFDDAGYEPDPAEPTIEDGSSVTDTADGIVPTRVEETTFKEPQTGRFFKTVLGERSRVTRDDKGFTATEEQPVDRNLGDGQDLSRPSVRQALANALDSGRTGDKEHQVTMVDEAGELNPKTGKPFEYRFNLPALVMLGRVLRSETESQEYYGQEIRNDLMTAMGLLHELGLVNKRKAGRLLGLPGTAVVYVNSASEVVTLSEVMASPNKSYGTSEWDGEQTGPSRSKKTVHTVHGKFRRSYKDEDATEGRLARLREEYATADEKRRAEIVAEVERLDGRSTKGDPNSEVKKAEEGVDHTTRNLETLDDQATASAKDRAPGTTRKVQGSATFKKLAESAKVVLHALHLDKGLAKAVEEFLNHIGLKMRVQLLDETGIQRLIDSLRIEYKSAAKERKAEILDLVEQLKDVLSGEVDARIIYNDTAESVFEREPIIFISENVSGSAQVQKLVHELGHLVQRAALDQASPEVQSALREALGTENFAENFANELLKWVAARKEPSGIVEKFFASVVENLKALWNKFRGRLKAPNATFAEFMDALVEVRRAQDGGPAPKTRMGKQLESLPKSPFLPKRSKDDAKSHNYTGEATVNRVRNSRLFNNRRAETLIAAGRRAGSLLNVIYERGLKSADAFLRSFNNPALNHIADHFHHRPGDVKRGATLYEAVRRRSAPLHRQLHDLMKRFAHTGRWVFKSVDKDNPHYKAFMDALIREDGSAAKIDPRAHREVRGMFDKLYAILRDAGVNIKHRKNYFPLVWDLAEWNSNRESIIDILMQHDMNREQATEMYENIANSNGVMIDSLEAEDSLLGPSFKFAQARHMTTDLAKALSAYRVTDLQSIMSYYIDAAYRRAEVNRRWAFTKEERMDKEYMDYARAYLTKDELLQPTAKLKLQLREQLKLGNITQNEYNYITSHVLEGYFGRLGANTDPRWRQLSSAAIVYQNLRLLSMATLSSLIDAGVLIWRGGSLRSAFSALQAVLNKQSREELYETARMLGAIRDDITDHVLNDPVSSQMMGPSFKTWNEAFFRAIGMHGWTNAMRVMGLHMARDYLKRHANSNSADSVRRLKELGIAAGDVLAWEEAGMPLDGHDAVNSAINTFIDEAVLRPEAPVRPTWGNDSRLAVFFHLKSFMWAFHETVLRRVASETKNKAGLYKALPALTMIAATLPFAILGYETRRKLAWWGEEPPGLELDGLDYMWEMAQRSGYLGILQVVADAEQAEEYGKISLLSVAGPTVDQISEFFQKDFDYFMLRSIPVLAQSGAARAWIRDNIL